MLRNFYCENCGFDTDQERYDSACDEAGEEIYVCCECGYQNFAEDYTVLTTGDTEQ